jgi:ribosomal protein S18 acetylase RimI-like enzyme
LIREAETEDLFSIVDMIRAGSDEGIFHSRCDSLEEQREAFRKYAFERRPEGYGLLVYQAENRIEGYVDYQVKRGVGHILGIYVKQSCRRKGVGKRLMEKALERFNKTGCHKTRLEVFAHNPKAVDFYRQLGFIQKGFLRRDEGNKDVIIMSMFLP